MFDRAQLEAFSAVVQHGSFEHGAECDAWRDFTTRQGT